MTISEVAQRLADEAKELQNGMQERCKRLPDTADFQACFERVLRDLALTAVLRER